MSIIDPLDPLWDPEKHRYDLTQGEAWEAWAAQEITRLGLPAYRLQQRFIPSWALQQERERLARGRSPKELTEDRSLLRPYQVDLAIRLNRTRRSLVEVKALSPAAFSRPNIHIGLCEKYDRKVPRISAVILVNRKTREAWAIPFAPEEWTRRRSIWSPQTFDYAVPRSRLTPLEVWIDALKDGLHDTP